MNVIICGLPGSGKSTIAKEIAKRYNLKFYDGGDLLKEYARDLGYDIKGKNFWETKEGLEFLEKRNENPKFDLDLDKRWVEILDRGNCSITSWTMPWLYKGKAIRVWLQASFEKRVKQIMKRDKTDFEEAKETLKKRDKENKKLYFNLYGIKLGEDFKPFDIVLDTENLDFKGIKKILFERIEELLY